jgi:hypothetical protein
MRRNFCDVESGTVVKMEARRESGRESFVLHGLTRNVTRSEIKENKDGER